ncbi:MAG: hypothetical protein CMJ80_15730 [Planctomycetaceae bacterium]|nr:hypothetical protein [Planctomycetaceae bacterium]
MELAYDADWELEKDDAEILIRLRGGDVLWQKERLLNVAMDAVPDYCEAIAWLDCDIIFPDENWGRLTLHQLEKNAIVQPFSQIYDQTSETDTAPCGPPHRTRTSLVYRVADNAPISEIGNARLRNEWNCASGLAWAGRRDILRQHGLYDACIVGGGDRAIACAAYGAWKPLQRRQCMNNAQRRFYESWAVPFHECVNANVGYVPGVVINLVHGTTTNRNQARRFQLLEQYDFDPFTDLTLDRQGAWQWATDKQEMHDFVNQYFQLRAEDTV